MLNSEEFPTTFHFVYSIIKALLCVLKINYKQSSSKVEEKSSGEKNVKFLSTMQPVPGITNDESKKSLKSTSYVISRKGALT